ncbi:MAG: hypothetical protein LBD87_03005 [Prevotellaceae bacterium]|nr:hypothetical protein [Prevotellaceae bacterium]
MRKKAEKNAQKENDTNYKKNLRKSTIAERIRADEKEDETGYFLQKRNYRQTIK